ncbi:MAG: anti-sigma factor antagonist [Candidatus Omnitrophota bacterium]|nr:MAG: anti-sigma factor antagonist [Candidatus Omnitrophota bacterium]
MRIIKKTQGDVVMLTVSGAISFMDTSTLKTMLHRLAHEGKKKIIVDCKEMDSLNSIALGIFLKAYKSMQEGSIAFANVNPHVQKVFHDTNLDSIFPLYNSIEEALDFYKHA